MRLIRQNIERDGSGSITFFPEEPEDMWFTYNLIRPSDLLRASAIRRITTESSTGSTSSSRIHTTLTIRVTKTDFDAQSAQLHVSGRIVEETKFAKTGQHHTLDLELRRNFSLEKSEGWDSVAMDMVRQACDPAKAADVWVVVMQEGLANLAVLTGARTVLRQRVEVAVPRKRAGGAGAGDHDQALQTFFQTTLSTLLRHIDLSESKPILLASPGFTASSFQTFILTQATLTNNKSLLSQKKNFIIAHSSSGHLHALAEVLSSPAVQTQLKDTQYARETRLMDDFFALLRQDDDNANGGASKAWYGPLEIERAAQRGALGKGGGVLLISNRLFRSEEIAVRKRWVRLVDEVRDVQGGEVRVLSSEHESGRRLEALGGVAAILSFPLGGLDEDLEEDLEGEGGEELNN